MFEFFKHFTSKTKILLIGFVLILIPVGIISYMSLRSVNQKAENLKTGYLGAVRLVRDKLESEVLKIESDLRNSVIETFPNLGTDKELKLWLTEVERQHPAFNHLFLDNNRGGLISSDVSLGWEKEPVFSIFTKPGVFSIFNQAEKAELIRKDCAEAILLYQNALNQTNSAGERTLILSRIGRCYFKTGNYNRGITEYEKIITPDNKEIRIGNVPAAVIALSQISNGYDLLNAKNKKRTAILHLWERLLENPWDLQGGDYLHYLNAVLDKIHHPDFLEFANDSVNANLAELKIREKALLEQIGFIKRIHQSVLPEMESVFRQEVSPENQIHYVLINDDINPIQVGYFRLPASLQPSGLLALGYGFDKDFILSKLFAETLNTVELGKGVFVGILGNNDSLLYIQHDRSISDYLVTENFVSRFDNWKVALFDKDGKSIEQLVGKEKNLYRTLFGGIILVMLLGIVVIVRAVIHESDMARLKSEFVSNVSHELKTPLALIRMFGETLDSGIVTDENKRREFYSIIRKESERLTHLINNVLDFSKMDTGVKKYYFEEADLVEVVRSSLEAYKFHIRDNGFEIESVFPIELIILKIDKDAISQALLNLLSNAVKYSEEKKYIVVEVHKDSTSALISVTDRGVGIAKEELKKIFDKFYQAPAIRGKDRRGSGLGLSLTKHIIEAHGGTIEVESEVGKGSRFKIRIPLFGI